MGINDLALTITPVDYFRKFIGLDPYHFWQMTKDDHPMHGYSHIYPQERWMYNVMAMPGRDAKRGPSRADIINAIADAEQKIASVSALNTWPGPKYTENEEVLLRSPIPHTSIWPARTEPYGLRTRWWHVQYVGVRMYTPIAIDVDISGDYDTSDNVTFTVGVASGRDAGEVVVTYPGTFVQVRPITVVVSGTTATITIKKWLLGDPDDWETSDAIDADVDANLLQLVDVYRYWIDPSDQILLAWEPGILACGCLDTENCHVCDEATVTACAVRKDYKIGYVGWKCATWNASTLRYDSATCVSYVFPSKAYISYEHGFPVDGDRYISNRWMETVCKLAAAQLPDYVEDTTSRPDALWYWRHDMTWVEGFNRHTLSQTDLNNPFGTKRGHVEAWQEVLRAVGD